MLRSMGYESEGMTRRLKLQFLVRLIPLAERNYNLVELGPRGTGKSYVVQEVSPYAALLTGPTTVANLFGHMGRRRDVQMGTRRFAGRRPQRFRMSHHDDEDLLRVRHVQRGQEQLPATRSSPCRQNQPAIDFMCDGSPFRPMPESSATLAFIDRFTSIPRWRSEDAHDLFTNHMCSFATMPSSRELRNHTSPRSSTVTSARPPTSPRDRKAGGRPCMGVTILHPHGDFAKKDEILELAIEGRRRVKEQLKKMGSFEYYHTSFSYTLQETGEEKFVGVPEQGGRDLISTDPLPPGTVYTAGVTSDGTVGLYRVELSASGGTGKLKMAGGVAGAMKESVQRAFSYLQSKKGELGITRDLDTSDLHVEVIDLLGNRVEAELGVAFFVAAYSALRKAPVSPALLVLGDMSVQGNIKPLRSLVEPLRVAGNVGQASPLPIENNRTFLDVSADSSSRGPDLLWRPEDADEGREVLPRAAREPCDCRQAEKKEEMPLLIVALSGGVLDSRGSQRATAVLEHPARRAHGHGCAHSGPDRSAAGTSPNGPQPVHSASTSVFAPCAPASEAKVAVRIARCAPARPRNRSVVPGARLAQAGVYASRHVAQRGLPVAAGAAAHRAVLAHVVARSTRAHGRLLSSSQSAASRGAPPARRLSGRPPEAEVCFSTRALAQAVDERLGRRVVVSASDAELSVEASVVAVAEPPGWRATVVLRDVAGRSLGSREIGSDGPSCEALRAPLAVVIAVLVDPSQLSRRKPARSRAAPPPAPFPQPHPQPPWRISVWAGGTAARRPAARRRRRQCGRAHHAAALLGHRGAGCVVEGAAPRGGAGRGGRFRAGMGQPGAVPAAVR